MISSPRSSLIYLSDPIYRSDPDILHLDGLSPNDGEWNESDAVKELSSSSIRPPFLRNAFQIHKKRPLSPRNGEEIWLRMEEENDGRKRDQVDFAASTLPHHHRPQCFQEPFPSPMPQHFRNKDVKKYYYSNKIMQNDQSFQKLALEEPSCITKSLPLIPQSTRKAHRSKSPRPRHEFPSSRDSLISKSCNHSTKNPESAQSITDFWTRQTLKSKEKLRRKKDDYRKAFTTGVITVAVTLCLTFLVLYWNYSETLHRRRTKKEGLILDHWGKKAPSKEEMRKLIEENSKDFTSDPSTTSRRDFISSSSMKSTTPKISRRDNLVIYIDT